MSVQADYYSYEFVLHKPEGGTYPALTPQPGYVPPSGGIVLNRVAQPAENRVQGSNGC